MTGREQHVTCGKSASVEWEERAAHGPKFHNKSCNAPAYDQGSVQCCAVLCSRRIFLRSWYVAEAVRRMRSVRKGQVWGWPSRLVYLWRGLRSFEAAADVVMALMGKQACIDPTEEEDSCT